jgi:hypothetical protein
MATLTVTHEAPLELIRQHPSLAVELVRATLSIPLPEDLEARLGPTDLNNVVPAQFTADSVITLHDPGTGEPVLVVIIEPQGRADFDKQRPVANCHRSAARSKHRRRQSLAGHIRRLPRRPGDGN